MVDIKTLNLSESIHTKLNEKKIKEITEADSSFFTAIEEGSSINADGSVTNTPLILSIVKKCEAKKLKSNRTPKAIVVMENSASGQLFLDELNTIITKEVEAALCFSDSGIKKNKKKISSATDVIIGDITRINALIQSDSLKLSTVTIIAFIQAKNIINESLKADIESVINKISEGSKLQIILTQTESNAIINEFLSKNMANCVTIGESEESSNGDSDDESEEDSDESSEKPETKVVELNGEADASSSEEETSEEGSEEKSEAEEMEEKKKTEEPIEPKIDAGEEIAKKIKNVTEFAEFECSAKHLISEDGDVKSLARAMALIASKTTTQAKQGKKNGQVAYSGDVSKLTGRAGYTAYIFKTNIEAFSKGYLFKGLKRHIEEELVEKIERVQQSADKMQFVFDLANDLNETFQASWQDGKFDSMELLTGDIPELLPADYRAPFDASRGRGGSERGGARGRGGFERGGRGGSRGRGGFESRGRGGSDRGTKRPFNGGPGGPTKVQKFE